MKQASLVVIALVVFASHIFSQSFWERIEPYAGTLNKVHFVGGDTIYGTLNSGFTRSTNNGTTWSTPVIVDYVTDMAVAPNGYIFLSENQKKISRSTNKGTSWTIVGTGINEPSCSSVMTTAAGTIIVGTNGGIYRSTNNGDGWQKTAGAAQLGSDTTISCFATYDGAILYAFTRVFTGSDYSYAVRSTDDGITWTKSAAKLDSVAIYKAIVHPNGTIYVRTGNGLRYSSDGGNSWGTAGFYNEYISDVAYGPDGEVHVTLSNGSQTEFYKTTNNGANWTAIATPSFGGGVIAVNKAGNIFIGQDQVYRSSDGGVTWNGLPISFPNVGIMKENPKHELYFTAGGSAYQKLYRSTDFGQSWNALNTGVGGIPIVAFYAETLLVADNFYPAKIYRSTDNGKTFKSISGISVLSGYVNALLATSYNSIIAGTSTGIYRSIDHGKNWTKVSTNPLTFLHQTSNGTMYGFREFYGNGVLRSNDSGSTWQEVKNGMGLTTVRSLSFAPNGDLIAGTENGVFRSTNSGDYWVRLDTQKVNKPYGIFAAVNIDGKLFMGGAKSGVNSESYQSTDNGATWVYIENNIKTIDAQANMLGLFSASNGHLFAATSAGVFRSVEKTTGVVRVDRTIPLGFSLGQNYPNPFNPNTTIIFSLQKNGYTTLKIYDLAGREITTLIEQQLSSGTYQVTFNGQLFSSGTYFYQLQSGDIRETKRMVLLK